jgi:hypothetical protein
MASARHKDVEQSPQVDVEILGWRGIADSGTRLAREVKYQIGVGNGCVNDSLVSNVTPVDIDLGQLFPRDDEVRRPRTRQDANASACMPQGHGQVEAQEPESPRDQGELIGESLGA